MISLKRRVAEAVADYLGLVVLPKIDAPAWPEENYWRQIVSLLQIDCVFDVGANIGQYASRIRKLGFPGTILSFEPQPAAFEKLAMASSGDPDWHVFPWALGNKSGKMPFNVMEYDVFSSFRSPSTDELVTFKGMNTVIDTVEVDMFTLNEVYDGLAREHDFAHPFLKMDTQGFDLEVVEGAAQSLRHFQALLSEVAIKRIYHDSPDYATSIRRYQEHGFELAALFPVHPQELTQMVECNCYMVRSLAAHSQA